MTTEHQMFFPQLPYYLTVFKVVDEANDLVSVLVRSTIHANKEVRLPMQYSLDYARDKPNEVYGDILHHTIKRFGLKLEPVKYS